MKIFEKIYWTLAVVSAVVLGIGWIAAFGLDSEKLMIASVVPFGVLAGIFMLDCIICEVILRSIWEVDFTLFPSLFTEAQK